MNENEKKDLSTMSEEELTKLKRFLFEEQIRVQAEKDKQKEVYEKFTKERATFFSEMKALNRKVLSERKRLKEETSFFDKKMQILKNGFFQLDMDRKQFEREKKMHRQRTSSYSSHDFSRESMPNFFKGVNSSLGLKKRYRDLLKIYHPDNMCGDRETVVEITRQYEALKNKM